ncbi:MAG: sporulation protein YqfD, partial [Clostridiales bacterium]
LPVEVVLINYREEKEILQRLDQEQAGEYALDIAKKAALRELPLDAKIINSKIISPSDDNNIKRASVTIEVLENIGSFQAGVKNTLQEIESRKKAIEEDQLETDYRLLMEKEKRQKSAIKQ